MRGITLRKQLMDGQQNLHCQYLDFLATRNVSYTAAWSERSRCEKRLALKVNDGPQLGQNNDRDVFPNAARVRAALQRQRGWVNPTSRKMNETDNDLEWQSWHWNVNQSQASSLISTYHKKESGKIRNGWKNGDYSLSLIRQFFRKNLAHSWFWNVSRTDISEM